MIINEEILYDNIIWGAGSSDKNVYAVHITNLEDAILLFNNITFPSGEVKFTIENKNIKNVSCYTAKFKENLYSILNTILQEKKELFVCMCSNTMTISIYDKFENTSRDNSIEVKDFITEEINPEKTYNREYTKNEIENLIKNKQLDKNDIIIDDRKEQYTKDKFILIKETFGENFINMHAPYILKNKNDLDCVSFEKALESNKKFKYKEWNEYYTVNNVFLKLGQLYDDKTIKDLLEDKVWLVDDNQ